jgi:hypothetical protein
MCCWASSRRGGGRVIQIFYWGHGRHASIWVVSRSPGKTEPQRVAPAERFSSESGACARKLVLRCGGAEMRVVWMHSENVFVASFVDTPGIIFLTHCATMEFIVGWADILSASVKKIRSFVGASFQPARHGQFGCAVISSATPEALSLHQMSPGRRSLQHSGPESRAYARPWCIE